MLPVPQGVRVWLAPGHTDMRKGFPGLSLLVQETLKKDPHAGHLFVFRGRRAAAILSLIETCKLNDVDAEAWLADVLARLADHPAKNIGELLPLNWKPTA